MDNGTHNLRRKLLNPFKGDKAIWFIFLALAVISLVAVFSSIGYTAISTHSTPGRAFFKHLAFVIVTFIGVILLSNVDYRQFYKLSPYGYVLALFLLGMTFTLSIGSHSAGSGMSRWMEIPLIGKTLQPSEFAKIVIIVYLARMVTQFSDQLKEKNTFRNILIATFIIIGLIFFDNFSTAFIIFIVCYLMLRLSPVNLKHWRIVLIAIVSLGLLVVLLGEKTEIPLLARAGTWSSRIDKWLNFDENELSQESMARMAVASGKFFGVGVGSTIQARLMTQANNDLIYSIIIEETGMAGGIIVLFLYIFLYIRCVRVAWNSRDNFGYMAAFGLGTLIFLQAAIHMCVSVGALPVTGQTLPFISTGGSAYICMGLALGIIQSISCDNEARKNS